MNDGAELETASQNPRYEAGKSMAKTIQLLGTVLIGMVLWIQYQVLASISMPTLKIPNLAYMVYGPEWVAIPWNPYGPILAVVLAVGMLLASLLRDPSVVTDVWLPEETGSK